MRHPQCLELVDRKGKLESFVREHAEELKKVRVLMFQGEALKTVSID